MGYLYKACDEISDFCHQYLLRKMRRKMSIYGSQKHFPQYGIPIWSLWPNTLYQIPIINICWEKCDEKCAYMLNVYKSQLSRQTGSRNLTGQKTLPTKWGTYMKLVTKYQISAINICWEKCDDKWAYMGPTNASHNMAYLYEACDQITDSCHQ